MLTVQLSADSWSAVSALAAQLLAPAVLQVLPAPHVSVPGCKACLLLASADEAGSFADGSSCCAGSGSEVSALGQSE